MPPASRERIESIHRILSRIANNAGDLALEGRHVLVLGADIALLLRHAEAILNDTKDQDK